MRLDVSPLEHQELWKQTLAEFTPGGFRAIMSIVIIRETLEIMLMMTTMMRMMKMITMVTVVIICRCYYK